MTEIKKKIIRKTCNECFGKPNVKLNEMQAT